MEFDNVKCLQSNIFEISENKPKCYCNSNSLDYYHEMEVYESKLKESHNLIIKQETELSLVKEQYRKDISKLNDDISKYKEKFERLHESHKRISRLNHDLEERTLTLVENFNSEKVELENNYKDTLSKYQISQSFLSDIQDECERYRKDCMVAVQLLQNNPSQFLTRNIDTLPLDLKERLMYLERDIEISNSLVSKPYLNNQEKNQSNSYVPIFTYPPTAMIFSDQSTNKRNDQNLVCPSILAQILHPDKISNQNFGQTKATLEIVCNSCGHVTEYRDASIQTMPLLLLPNSNSKSGTNNVKKNQNLVFDV